MRKRKIKNYFKLGLLLIGIPFALVNCEKDIEIIELTESNQQVFNPIKNLTLNEALNDIEFYQISILLNLTKKDLAHKNSQDEVIYIDTKKILKIVKKEYTTYTFLVINKKQENKNSFTNLIVEKSPNKTQGYLAHYIPTNEYLNKKAKGIKTPFHGSVSFSPFTEDLTALLNTLNKKINNTSKNNLQSRTTDCYYQTLTIETSCASGQHWPGEGTCIYAGTSLAASTRYVEALMCGDGGGGSGIIYEYHPIFIGENENIGIGGSDGSVYIPPSGSTYPNLPAEITDNCPPELQNAYGECLSENLYNTNFDGEINIIDDSDYNIDYLGEKALIPNQIILNNGKSVSITFGTTKDQVNANQPVAICLIDAIKYVLNQTSDITSIHIHATTNGHNAYPNSNHLRATAIDISRINGVHIINLGNNSQVMALQNAFDNYHGIRENFGPSYKHKTESNGLKNNNFNISGHKDHIHISIQSNTKCN
ncbi:MAG: hypothetical protein Q8J84_00970 [Flavobacteriaceae bacterium]|nr:hypothetical protein [Flavobacteriaceae bacterium]